MEKIMMQAAARFQTEKKFKKNLKAWLKQYENDFIFSRRMIELIEEEIKK